jgi:hypothetical protein
MWRNFKKKVVCLLYFLHLLTTLQYSTQCILQHSFKLYCNWETAWSLLGYTVIVTNCTIIVLSLRDLVLYSGLILPWSYGHIVGLHVESGQCPLLLNSYKLSGWVSVNHKYDLSSNEIWMSNKPRKSFMQPMRVCLQWLNSCWCHTQLYARLWYYLSSYSKLIDLCVCICLYGIRIEIFMFGGF